MSRRNHEYAIQRVLRRMCCAALLLAVVIGPWGRAAPALAGKGGGSVNIIRLGSAADATASLSGPSFFLQGNGAPTAAYFENHVDQVASRH
jgi:hypothetical protein